MGSLKEAAAQAALLPFAWPYYRTLQLYTLNPIRAIIECHDEAKLVKLVGAMGDQQRGEMQFVRIVFRASCFHGRFFSASYSIFNPNTQIGVVKLMPRQSSTSVLPDIVLSPPTSIRPATSQETEATRTKKPQPKLKDSRH